MTYTDHLIGESRERARVRANILQSDLGQRLHEINQSQFARLKLGLNKLKTQHINLLDQAVVNRVITLEVTAVLWANTSTRSACRTSSLHCEAVN